MFRTQNIMLYPHHHILCSTPRLGTCRIEKNAMLESHQTTSAQGQPGPGLKDAQAREEVMRASITQGVKGKFLIAARQAYGCWRGKAELQFR
jgi:hypothetical protein